MLQRLEVLLDFKTEYMMVSGSYSCVSMVLCVWTVVVDINNFQSGGWVRPLRYWRLVIGLSWFIKMGSNQTVVFSQVLVVWLTGLCFILPPPLCLSVHHFTIRDRDFTLPHISLLVLISSTNLWSASSLFLVETSCRAARSLRRSITDVSSSHRFFYVLLWNPDEKFAAAPPNLRKPDELKCAALQSLLPELMERKSSDSIY